MNSFPCEKINNLIEDLKRFHDSNRTDGRIALNRENIGSERFHDHADILRDGYNQKYGGIDRDSNSFTVTDPILRVLEKDKDKVIDNKVFVNITDKEYLGMKLQHQSLQVQEHLEKLQRELGKLQKWSVIAVLILAISSAIRCLWGSGVFFQIKELIP